jgi:hypothetical protein
MSYRMGPDWFTRAAREEADGRLSFQGCGVQMLFGPRRRVIPHGIRHTLLRPAFWLGLTLGFPLEHLLWEKAPVFSAITRWLGL